MIFLFSDSEPGPLAEGASFMQARNCGLCPADSEFYQRDQREPLHSCVTVGANTNVADVQCALSSADAEVAILIGHGGGNQMFSEAGKDVTQKAIQLVEAIINQNAGKHVVIFVAACGSARRPAGLSSSLIATLATGAGIQRRMLKGEVRMLGYSAQAGLVDMSHLPVHKTYQGIHIYGVLRKGLKDRHCGYDQCVTAELRAVVNVVPYVVFHLSRGLEDLDNVKRWAQSEEPRDFAKEFPHLFSTLSPVR